jgi:glutamate/tyrosine decarboxylase-like PLP-dependent enzyme
MVASLLNGDKEVVGNMTSGGTESLLMAVKTVREWARAHRPEIQSPEMILPLTAHPAFEKAAHYFGVKPVRIPVRADFRADVEAAKAAITPRTILMVGSAPSYPHELVIDFRYGSIAASAASVPRMPAGGSAAFRPATGLPVPD